MQILFFGMHGELSRAPLEALLQAGAQVCAVVTPAQGPPPLPALAPLTPPTHLPIPLFTDTPHRTMLELAWEQGIPAFASASLSAPETLSLLGTLQPDLACVSCFDRRIPTSLLALPRLGFLNLHPALLPAHRGPDPLFWIFRQGQDDFGVTIHQMDAGLDSGDILLQAPLHMPDGSSGAEAEHRCAELGGELLVAAVHALAEGNATPHPQPPGGSYEPWPSAADFAIDPAWPARRAFNFMRGSADWGQPYPLSIAERSFKLATALSYDSHATLPAPYLLEEGIIRVQCNPGVLSAALP